MKTILTFAILVICACIPCKGDELLHPELAAERDSIIRMLNIDTNSRSAMYMGVSGIYIVAVENLDKKRYDIYFPNPKSPKPKKASLPYPNTFVNHILNVADSVSPIIYEPRDKDTLIQAFYYMRSCNPKTGKTVEWSSKYGIRDVKLGSISTLYFILLSMDSGRKTLRKLKELPEAPR